MGAFLKKMRLATHPYVVKKTTIIGFVSAIPLFFLSHAPAASFNSPDILILGDSQLAFGTGPTFLNFFQNLETNCPPKPEQRESLAKLGDMSVSVIGVRSTSLHSWSKRRGKAKDKLCHVDPNWQVNARVYGDLEQRPGKYVQIGEGEAYDFCQRRKSGFEAMFRDDYYHPKLLVLSFLGNSDKRWATDKVKAKKDIQRTVKQIPAGLPCIFMTTAPVFDETRIDLRLRAQQNAKEAFLEAESHCGFVEGLTAETIKQSQGNKDHFKINESGNVEDPFHPNKEAASQFFTKRMKDICMAVFDQLKNK